MKPFDLEAAKRGEPICTIEGELRHFIGKRLSGNLIVEVPSNEQSYTTSAEFLRMAPKKKVKMWQFVYKGKGPPHITGRFYPTLEDATEGCSGAVIIQRADWTEIEVEES